MLIKIPEVLILRWQRNNAVFALSRAGFTGKDIAFAIGVSYSTVRDILTLKQICSQIGVKIDIDQIISKMTKEARQTACRAEYPETSDCNSIHRGENE